MTPQVWATRPLGDYLKCAPRYGINAAAVPFSDRLPTYIRITDITSDGRFVPSPPVSVDHPDSAQYLLEDGDLVFARTGASVGKSYLYMPADGPLVFAGFLLRIRPNPAQLRPSYLAAFVQTAPYWEWVHRTSMRSGQPGINGREYCTLLVPLAPLEEQDGIAGCLGNVDALIRGLDQLIAKKRDLKQAVMQQLLTGKTRLPGFSEEWQERCVGDVADVDPESLGPGTPPNYAFKYISLEDVDSGTLTGFAEHTFASSPSRARRVIRKSDILIGTVRPNLRSHLLFNADESNWVCSTGFAVIRCRNGISSPAYLFAQFFGDAISRQVDALLTGSNYPSINGGDVRELRIPVPSFEEQAAIAEVVSDIDAEIAALEARREKTRVLKQGMMQELLTGKIRLV